MARPFTDIASTLVVFGFLKAGYVAISLVLMSSSTWGLDVFVASAVFTAAVTFLEEWIDAFGLD